MTNELSIGPTDDRSPLFRELAAVTTEIGRLTESQGGRLMRLFAGKEGARHAARLRALQDIDEEIRTDDDIASGLDRSLEGAEDSLRDTLRKYEGMMVLYRESTNADAR